VYDARKTRPQRVQSEEIETLDRRDMSFNRSFMRYLVAVAQSEFDRDSQGVAISTQGAASSDIIPGTIDFLSL
jgi:hypothetical protein